MRLSCQYGPKYLRDVSMPQAHNKFREFSREFSKWLWASFQLVNGIHEMYQFQKDYLSFVQFEFSDKSNQSGRLKKSLT